MVLLVAGLCGCEKIVPEFDLVSDLEGDWEKVYPDGVQDAEQLIWKYITGNEDPYSWVLSIHVSDVFAGDSEAKHIERLFWR